MGYFENRMQTIDWSETQPTQSYCTVQSKPWNKSTGFCEMVVVYQKGRKIRLP